MKHVSSVSVLILIVSWFVVPLGRCNLESFAEGEEAYTVDFEKIEEGEVPADFLVLEGEFAVKETEGNRVLELPGQPLGTFTCLMGPAKTENVSIEARFKCERKKRRRPVFAVGLSGISGYRLEVNPARRALELYREEVVEASVPYRWKTGSWTHLKLQVLKSDSKSWKIEGKAWTENEEEPEDWAVSYQDGEEPLSGRPSIWGIPYSGKPIYFDDIKVESVPEP